MREEPKLGSGLENCIVIPELTEEKKRSLLTEIRSEAEGEADSEDSKVFIRSETD